MARTSVDNTIQRIRRQLAASFRYETNVLLTTVDNDDTTIAFAYDLPAQLVVGSLLSIGVETMRVLTVNRTAKTCTVVRGYYDSDGATHTAGDEVVINARHEPIDIHQAMIEEVGSWGPQLYRVVSDTLAVAESVETLELPVSWADCYGIIDVRSNRTSDDTTSWPRQRTRLIRGEASTWDAAPTSGLLLRFIDSMGAGQVYVTVARPFDTTAMTTTADLVTDVGLAESMIDVLQLGVKLRLLMDNEYNRTTRDVQDMPRRAEETPVSSFVPTAQLAMRFYTDRKQQEINKLRARYPVVIS